jgi:predicted nuclease with TOPRIM domain
MSDRDRGRAAELRAERIGWRKRSRSMSQASRSMDEHLRQMNEEASLLDTRLRRHGEENESWHSKWDDPSDT